MKRSGYYTKVAFRFFTERITEWYLRNKRDLPWRKTRDPYKIWLSEIILQQTRVAQGLPYYEKFIGEFPNIKTLAHASRDKILKLWEGLGYYTRAKHLHETAKYVAKNLNGGFPKDYVSLLQLKGIGKYTAAAIASFSNNERVALLDGNVIRLLTRFFGIKGDTTKSSVREKLRELSNEILQSNRKIKSSVYNQAVMEFGALLCVPKNPVCKKCILKNKCHAFQNNKVELLPMKSPKNPSQNKYFHVFLIRNNKGKIMAGKRNADSYWKNLYELPMKECSKKDFLLRKNPVDFNGVIPQDKGTLLHQFSHLNLNIHILDVKTDGKIKMNGYKFHSSHSLSQKAFPRAIHKIFERCGVKLE